MWDCGLYLLNCYINEIGFSHFLDSTHISHPPRFPLLPSDEYSSGQVERDVHSGGSISDSPSLGMKVQ